MSEIARHVRAQAPPAEWKVIRDFAVQVLALAEATEAEYSVAVVPASVLQELSGAPLLAAAQPAPAHRVRSEPSEPEK